MPSNLTWHNLNGHYTPDWWALHAGAERLALVQPFDGRASIVFYIGNQEVSALRGDPAVDSVKGIYEYLLGGKADPQLLAIRLFSDQVKAAAYERQTQAAKQNGVSNCPHCAVAGNNNSVRIYKRTEMDADHVTAWSKGGATNLANCEMLCQTHNRAKENR